MEHPAPRLTPQQIVEQFINAIKVRNLTDDEKVVVFDGVAKVLVPKRRVINVWVLLVKEGDGEVIDYTTPQNRTNQTMRGTIDRAKASADTPPKSVVRRKRSLEKEGKTCRVVMLSKEI